MTSPTRFHPKQPPSTDRRRRRGAPRPSCAHLWSRRARSRHLPCVAKRYGPSSAVACLAEAVAFVGLLLPFSGLPAAFWGSRHCAASLGVRGSLVSIPSANLCRRHNRPPAKPGLLLASVSTDASALFFSCVFCASSFFLLAPRNRCRGRWHSIGLPSWPFCSIGLRSRRPRRAQHRPTVCSARPTARLTFFGGRARMGLPGAVLLGDRLGRRMKTKVVIMQASAPAARGRPRAAPSPVRARRR